MIVRIVGWVAACLFAMYALYDQMVRWAGSAPTFSFDLCVPNIVTIPTFLIAVAACLGMALSRNPTHRQHWAALVMVVLAPVYLSTRHVWVPFGSASMIEHGIFPGRGWIQPDADPEAVCYTELDGSLRAFADNGAGPKLWSTHLGVWPWVIKNEDYINMTDERLCKG